jgi:HEAT repeat protein
MIEDVLSEIEELGAVSGEKGLEFLIACSSHEDSEVRFRAMERMSEFLYGSENLAEIIRNVMQKGLRDSDELVRCAALEFFQDFEDMGRTEDVCRMLGDPSSLVRGQAALTLASMKDVTAVPHIERAVLQAEDVEKAPMLAALIDMGSSSARGDLLDLLRSPSYQARCAAANLLSESSVDSENNEMIATLRQCLRREASGAVISSMNDALNRLTNKKYL